MIEYRATLLEDLEEDEATALDLGGTHVVLVRRGNEVQARDAGRTAPRVASSLSDRNPVGVKRPAWIEMTGGKMPEIRGDHLPVRIVKGWVMVTLPGGAPNADCTMVGKPKDPRRFLIVGSGVAGARAAETLRREGFTGRLTVLSEDFHGPLENLALSGSYIAALGRIPRRGSPGPIQSCSADVELRHGEAASLDTRRREVILRHSHERIAYDRLLVATGCHTRRPNLPGATLTGVHIFRVPADADGPGIDIDALAELGRCRVVIVGGGAAGVDIARSLSTRDGVDVTLVQGAPTAAPGTRRAGAGDGTRRAGAGDGKIRVIAPAIVSGLLGDARVAQVALADGEILPADIVLMAPETAPRTGWLPFRTEEDGGIVVEPDLSVPGHPGIFLAGDIAHVPTPAGTLRIEHWRFARDTGELAASNMLGRGMVYDQEPPLWFGMQAGNGQAAVCGFGPAAMRHPSGRSDDAAGLTQRHRTRTGG